MRFSLLCLIVLAIYAAKAWNAYFITIQSRREEERVALEQMSRPAPKVIQGAKPLAPSSRIEIGKLTDSIKSAQQTGLEDRVRRTESLERARAASVVSVDKGSRPSPNYKFIANKWVKENLHTLSKVCADASALSKDGSFKALIPLIALPDDKNVWKEISIVLQETDEAISHCQVLPRGILIVVGN